jgi:hypothetical protein
MQLFPSFYLFTVFNHFIIPKKKKKKKKKKKNGKGVIGVTTCS